MDGGTQITFTYNKDGVRTSKGNIRYILDGSTVIGEERDDYNITYLLDENGSYIGFVDHNNLYSNKYYYVKNQQGDVVQLLNENLEVVANYAYNAWGLLLSVTDANGNAVTGVNHPGNMNPIRYRGYIYDTETGMCYCESRYYDPQIRRWISADGYVSTGQDYLGYNMYAYCLNNPVNSFDPSGTRCICLTQRVGPRHVCEKEKKKNRNLQIHYLNLSMKMMNLYCMTIYDMIKIVPGMNK